MHGGEIGEVHRADRQQERKPPLRDEQAETAAEDAQHEALGQQLADDPNRAGAERAADRDLTLTNDPPVWFIRTGLAWVPIVLADVWKTTPFVALLLLAGLQNIDARDVRGRAHRRRRPWRQLTDVTLPLLKPAHLVALVFRALDAFRVFDLVYVMTGGGPGTSTEPIALYTFNRCCRRSASGTARRCR